MTLMARPGELRAASVVHSTIGKSASAIDEQIIPWQPAQSPTHRAKPFDVLVDRRCEWDNPQEVICRCARPAHTGPIEVGLEAEANWAAIANCSRAVNRRRHRLW